MSKLVYNERSWAIDLSSKINQYAQNVRRAIARAGGELTLKAKGENSLFPDVILYGDEAASRVRHGWELKFPDTPISDPELIDNASKKAVRFGVNSFLLWNVDQAILYSSEDGVTFQVFHEWPALGIKSRDSVRSNEKLWSDYLITILNDLNDFFEDGTLRSASVSEILDENFFAGILEEYKGVSADSIRAVTRSKASLLALVSEWWINNAPEYGLRPNSPIDYSLLSVVVLTNWINRFLFSHYLKRFNSNARIVEAIQPSTSIGDALGIFEQITSQCDFLQVFRPEIATEYIGAETWEALCEINSFLTSLHLDELPQEILHEVIEQTLSASRRKAAGQYSTPTNLARLLTSLAIENRNGSVIDPCCGTGTIARAAYDLKRSVGLSVSDCLTNLWASDKYQFPLQLCTLSLADPEAIGQITRIFKYDVFDLQDGKEIDFIDPNTGNGITDTLSQFDSIVSNLPFVRFEDLKKTNPDIGAVITRNNDFQISGKSDLLAIILMHLRHLLQDNGRIGVIVSNSWLGAEWGEVLREAMEPVFQIKAVVTSGRGRWFSNADVVTNIIVLEKTPTVDSATTKFITTLRYVEDWNEEYISEVWRTSLTTSGNHYTDNANYISYSSEEIKAIGTYISGWSLFFSDVTWLLDIEDALVRVSSIFAIARGERRGWNAMFYPEEGHGIEAEYIRPVLRTARDIATYVASGDKEAFCCSRTKDELTALNHVGALAWINRFEDEVNGKGEPLPEVLARSGHYWYEMESETQADLVLGMNPSARVFIAQMSPRGFVDQRLIRFTALEDDLDLELCHALLNSLLGLLMIEASGFGRGLGALDLNATKLSNRLYMLNPDLLEEEQAERIRELFRPIKLRTVHPIDQEILMEDRLAFDREVLSAYGIQDYEERIRDSLLQIYRIRTSVFDDA